MPKITTGQSIAEAAGIAAELEREKCAELVDALRGQAPYNKHPMARMALFIAARAIRRGRLLTETEKLNNLIRNFEEEGDHDLAKLVRELTGVR